MTEHEMEELLRQLDPVRGADLPSADDAVGRAIRGAALTRAKRRGRRALVAAIAAVVVLLGASAAALFLRSDEPSQPTVVCFTEADVAAPAVEGFIELGADTEACAPLWQDGTLGDGAVVPPLVACVLDSGSVAVFPGDETTCEDLGLVLAINTEVLDPAIDLSSRLPDLIPDDACLPVDETVVQVKALLDDLDLTVEGWTVEVRPPSTPDRPCGSLGLEGADRLVVVVPIPDIWSS